MTGRPQLDCEADLIDSGFQQLSSNIFLSFNNLALAGLRPAEPSARRDNTLLTGTLITAFQPSNLFHVPFPVPLPLKKKIIFFKGFGRFSVSRHF